MSVASIMVIFKNIALSWRDCFIKKIRLFILGGGGKHRIISSWLKQSKLSSTDIIELLWFGTQRCMFISGFAPQWYQDYYNSLLLQRWDWTKLFLKDI